MPPPSSTDPGVAPSVAGADRDRGVPQVHETTRPRLRGRLHQLAAVASFAGLIWLVKSADGAVPKLAAWVYGLSCVALYLTSSSYHVFSRSPRARRVMQRLDHSMIYVLIAGTFTPLCLLGMDGAYRWPVLGVVWVGAIVGVVLKVVDLERFSRAGFALYLVLGWVGVLVVPTLLATPGHLLLVIGGGLLYTVGAVLFAVKRPRLSPRWFGYHEVWHAFGVAAGALFFVVNLQVVQHAAGA